jgi:hypothetical protein
VRKSAIGISQFAINSKSFQYQAKIIHVLDQILSRLNAPLVIHTDWR